jgi:glutamate synthase (NADPH) small chain
MPAETGKFAWSQIGQAGPPKRPAAERVHDFAEIYRSYDVEAVRAQASRCIQCPDALCAQACPLSNRIPEWLALTAQGQFLEAAEVSRSTSNMPEICARVCPQDRLCEGACILNCRTDPVSIGAIERFINDFAFEHGFAEAPDGAPNGRRVAVVGSGPGGIACADELTRLGYEVTVYEGLKIPGGLLVNGIPSFKLEKAVVERRFEMLEKRGVRFEMGVRVAQRPKLLDIPGGRLPGVIDALPFLIQKNVPEAQHDLPPIPVAGRRVVVLGGGDTAMDCLRTAIRCRASQTVCLYRRDLDNMPGSRKEFSNATEEGAYFEFQVNPIEIVAGPDGVVAEIRCERMELGEPDASGRRKPRAVPGSEFSIPADLVLIAFGFDPVPFPSDSELSSIERSHWGTLKTDKNQMTSIPGVFSGGDSVRGPSLVVHAVQDGRVAAAGIHRYLEVVRPAQKALP